MKSRKKKSIARSIIRRNKEILAHPEWWGDKDDEFHSPYINEMVLMGIYPLTWTPNSESIDNFYGDFVYTYRTFSDHSRSGLASLAFSRVSNIGGKMKSFDGYDVYVTRDSCGLIFEVVSEDGDMGSFKRAVSSVSDMLRDHHQAQALFIGSHNLSIKRELNSWGMLVMIMESYWDYAKGGITHMYRMKDSPASLDGFDVDSMFDKFELSSDELQYQKDEYTKFSDRLVTAAGRDYLDSLESRFAEKAEDKDE